MQFALTEEQLAVQKTARDFATAEVLPKAAEIDRAHRHPKELVARMAELGFLGIAVPEQWGGQGLDWWFTTAYAEEMVNCGMAGVTMALLVQSDMATPVIHEIGNDYHKANFLAPAVKGEAIAALGMGIAMTNLGSEEIAMPSVVYGIIAYFTCLVALFIGRRYIPADPPTSQAAA